MSDDTLYAKRGKRYLPWGRFYDPGVIQCGTWLVRCTETGTSYYRIDDSAEPPVVPPLPMEARQGVTPSCSPTCLQRWNQQAEQWRQRLTDAE